MLANSGSKAEDAEALVRHLNARGYKANVVRQQQEGRDSYKVRVGPYANVDEAKAAMRELHDHEGVDHAFVASEWATGE